MSEDTKECSKRPPLIKVKGQSNGANCFCLVLNVMAKLD